MDSQPDSGVAAETPASRPNTEQHDRAEKAASSIQRRAPPHALPIRQYLESTVVPILMQAMQNLCKERPEDPVEYIANYLLQHNPKKNEPAAKGGKATGAPAASDSVA